MCHSSPESCRCLGEACVCEHGCEFLDRSARGGRGGGQTVVNICCTSCKGLCSTLSLEGLGLSSLLSGSGGMLMCKR